MFATVIRRSLPRKVVACGMATEKQLKTRINGTLNIAKITKSMKMVSAAKLRGDQARLTANWAYNLTGKERNLEDLDVSDFPQHNVFVVMTTDKGLCGGVNSILTRMTKQVLAKMDKAGKTYELIVCGEKGRMQLRRSYGQHFASTVTERAMPYTFDMASSIAQDVMSKEYDAVHLVYNEFKSAIAYIPSIKTITPLLNPTDQKLNNCEIIPRAHPEILLNMYEYTLATHIFHSLLENATSEQSSRMGAMENASKNASEMIGKLTLQYNRARQARITTELIEIISGAAALKN